MRELRGIRVLVRLYKLQNADKNINIKKQQRIWNSPKSVLLSFFFSEKKKHILNLNANHFQ